MIHSDRLNQVRVVEDKDKVGTVVSDNVSGSDARTIFPLQAALGYTIAQNLFIGKRNLLIEGAADLIILQYATAELESLGREGLRGDITLVPTGGLDKVATFVSLLGANALELVVLHDTATAPDPRLESLVKERILQARSLITYGEMRSASALKGKGKANAGGALLPPTDVEDLFEVKEYLALFNATFREALPSELTEKALPTGDRIVDRINRYLNGKGIQVRPRGGFNHYAVAKQLLSNPPESLAAATLARFEEMFRKVNALYSAADD
jgi:hypothetical protein